MDLTLKKKVLSLQEITSLVEDKLKVKALTAAQAVTPQGFQGQAPYLMTMTFFSSLKKIMIHVIAPSASLVPIQDKTVPQEVLLRGQGRLHPFLAQAKDKVQEAAAVATCGRIAFQRLWQVYLTYLLVGGLINSLFLSIILRGKNISANQHCEVHKPKRKMVGVSPYQLGLLHGCVFAH